MSKTLSRALAAFAAALLLAAAGVGALYLWADTLHRQKLDARTPVSQEEEHVTSFSLRAQEHKHQTTPRIDAWMSVISCEPVTMKTDRGDLSAVLYGAYRAKGAAPWAIVLHGGMGTDHHQVTDVACRLSLAGYRVLAPDLYAHGASDGEGSTLGWRDAQDVSAWIAWIERWEMNPKIVLFGQDEGAAAVLLAACDEQLPDSVAAVAADGAVDDVGQHALKLAELDADTPQAALLLWRLDIDADTAISERIDRASVPLLLIHGTGDAQVAAWQSEDIAAAAGENARLLLIEGAGHGDARYIDEATYYETLLAFYDAALTSAQ